MSRVAVRYQGLLVGELAEVRGGVMFEYDPAFVATGHELSPLNLPLGPGLRSRYTSPSKHLIGLFDDSLPDAWGERLMREWFNRRGTPWHDITPLMILSYVGHRGMGALAYEPVLQLPEPTNPLSLKELHEAAAQAERAGPVDLERLAGVGSSAGGAHPKALIGLPRVGSGDVLAGADELPLSHEAWLIKFNTSRDGAVGPMEQAYALMARAAGIEMPSTRLLETRHDAVIRRHFAVKRFDRDGAERIHHHTLAGMTQIGGSDLDYQDFLRVTRRIAQDEGEVWKAYRRAAFNVLASNRDDHGKNDGFLYRNREWRLGPAYDLTFRAPRDLVERGMAVCGERVNAGRAHLLKLAHSEALDKATAIAVIEEVAAAVAQWRTFADEADVPKAVAEDVERVLVKAARPHP